MIDEISYTELKEFLERDQIVDVAILIGELVERDRGKFIKNLLLSGILKEPLAMDFDFNDKIIINFFEAIKLVVKLNRDNGELLRICADIYISFKSISDLNISNTKELRNTGLFNIPIKKMIHMFCIFLESQSIYMTQELMRRIKNDSSKSIDIFQSDVADIQINPGGQISLADNNESGIEVVNILINYLYYMGRKQLLDEYIPESDLSPYNLPNIQKISMLTLHRKLLEDLWEKIKYQNWRPSKSYQKEKYFHFDPPDKKSLKLKMANLERKTYMDRINSYNINSIDLYKKQKHKTAINLENIRTLFDLDREIYIDKIEFYRHINVEKIESLGYVDSKFLSNKFFGVTQKINFGIYLNFIYYINCISDIYSETSHSNFDTNNRSYYKYLSPIIPKSLIIQHFAFLFDYDKEMVEDLIYLFTYSPKDKKNNTQTQDLFSQPFVFIDQVNIIFVPSLAKQFNIPRMIEQQLTIWGLSIPKKGITFENELRSILSKYSPYIKVNTNHVEFDAYDGQFVQYDFIATFENKILLVEMKCLKRPYSPKEDYIREKDVLDGVRQVNRRVKVLQHNWKEVKDRVDIVLPDSPPDESDIIKLVCLNIFDFTGQIIDGVFIIDESMLLKYFLSGEVEMRSLSSSGSEVIKTLSIWANNQPTVTEFIEFVKMPVALKEIYNSVEEQVRFIPLINDDDYKITFTDYSLIKNPYSHMLDTRKKNRVKVSPKNDKKRINKQKKVARKKQRKK